jgi:hypothetical protein
LALVVALAGVAAAAVLAVTVFAAYRNKKKKQRVHSEQHSDDQEPASDLLNSTATSPRRPRNSLGQERRLQAAKVWGSKIGSNLIQDRRRRESYSLFV